MSAAWANEVHATREMIAICLTEHGPLTMVRDSSSRSYREELTGTDRYMMLRIRSALPRYCGQLANRKYALKPDLAAVIPRRY